jgi:hypothetical protein
MARIFWVVCAQCLKKFYAAADDFRHQKDRRLLCPYCGARFTDQECEVIE